MTTRPLLAIHIVAYGGGDRQVYVAMTEERTQLYRFPTAGLIGEGLGASGTRTLLIPSADKSVRSRFVVRESPLDLSFGTPIEQEPLVADQDIFVVDTAGFLSRLDPETGTPRWTISTQGGALNAVSAKKVYLRSYNLDLFLIDRETGRTLPTRARLTSVPASIFVNST